MPVWTRRTFLASLAARPNEPKVLLDDGGWCWFEDERALLIGDNLIFGSVATGPQIAGQIRLTQYNLKTNKSTTTVLHNPANDESPKQWIDDHNSPALLHRPDGKILAMYARHGTRNQIHYRVTTHPNNAESWQPEKIFIPSEPSKVTYSNLFHLSKENRTYDFFRGIHNSYKPSYATSEDQGDTWTPGGIVVNVPHTVRHRPYAKYCSNNVDSIHMVYTEGHPRDFDNSIYHIVYRNGQLHRSDGTPIRALKDGLTKPEEGTKIFQGGPNAVGWPADFHLLPNNDLLLVYTVKLDRDGRAHTFRLARWSHQTGKWSDYEIAPAGTRIYAAEVDYTGLAALDPHDPQTLFISTNVHPVTNAPLKHREIFRGRTKDHAHFTWTPVTENSNADNLRPIIPISPGPRRALLWLRGEMRTYTDYTFQIVGLFENR